MSLDFCGCSDLFCLFTSRFSFSDPSRGLLRKVISLLSRLSWDLRLGLLLELELERDLCLRLDRSLLLELSRLRGLECPLSDRFPDSRLLFLSSLSLSLTSLGVVCLIWFL